MRDSAAREGAHQPPPPPAAGAPAAGPITLRPITEADLPLLAEIYARTRDAEMDLVDWDAAHKQSFLQMQFAAQHQYYQQHYQGAGASFDIILRDGEPVGRLYVARWEAEIRIVDIALLPAYRNAGLGTLILRQIQAEAIAAGKPIGIHVEQFNPALQLYLRLGFTPAGQQGIYYLMYWHPPP